MVSEKNMLYKKEVEKQFLHREKIKKKLGMKCVYCGCTNELIMTIDHIIPVCRGGKNIDSNKQVCCRICNALKGPLTDEEYRPYLKSLLIMKRLSKMRVQIEHPKIIYHQDWHPGTYLDKIKIMKSEKEEINIVKEKN